MQDYAGNCGFRTGVTVNTNGGFLARVACCFYDTLIFHDAYYL